MWHQWNHPDFIRKHADAEQFRICMEKKGIREFGPLKLARIFLCGDDPPWAFWNQIGVNENSKHRERRASVSFYKGFVFSSFFWCATLLLIWVFS